MALYYTLSGLIIGVLLQSNIGENIVVPTQSLPITKTPKNVCTTLACNESASQILYNIDESVDPCNNFYKFACGGFIDKTVLLNNESRMDSFEAVYDRIMMKLKSSLEEPISQNESRHVSVVKNFYKSCIDEDVIEQLGLIPLRGFLMENGGWPVVDGANWNETSFDWLDKSIRFHYIAYPKGYFLSFGVSLDLKNVTRKILTFDEPSLGLSRVMLIEGMNNTQVKAYFKLMVGIAMVLGVPENIAKLELEQSLKFEIDLAKLMLPESEHRNFSRLYNPMTIKELSQKYPTIPWKELINRMIVPHLTVDDNEIVMVQALEFISKFIDLIKVTPKRVQANYAIWRSIETTAHLYNKAITSKLAEFEMELKGTLEPKPRWRQCVYDVLEFTATKSIYVEKYFNHTIKNETMEIVSELMGQLNKTLRNLDWFDDNTRKYALEKAAAISTHVAYDDQLLNHTLIAMLYDGFNYNSSYFHNSMQLVGYNMMGVYPRYKLPLNVNHWGAHNKILEANAFHTAFANSIDILAGILQGVFFNETRPKYMNYGGLGSVVGHELTHVFGDIGRRFDKRGNLKNWWTSSTDKKYDQKAKCVIDQYNTYTVEEVAKKVNGLNSVSENTADIGGFKLAYLAYKNWVKTHGEEPTLPRLKYNPQQLFWLSASNVWCSKYRPKFLKNMLITDMHVPSEFRILGSFSNLPEFAADFNCPIGSKMNPKDKCTFW